MDSSRWSSLKITLVAGLALLTTDALFAQSASQTQSDVDTLKTQMNQMQKQYEQRIESMEAKMKALESNAESGSILNTHILGDANGVAEAGKGVPTPMLDESFLKSLTRNFQFSVYARAGVEMNGSGGAGNFNFEIPDNPGGRVRLGNENDLYTEPTWIQKHILGDSPDVMNVTFTFTPNFFTGRTATQRESFLTTNTTSNGGTAPFDFNIGLRQLYAEANNIFKGAPEITVWAGQRFYDRFDTNPQDYFWLDTSGFGMGFNNIHIGPGNLWIAWLANNGDNLNLANNPNQFNTVGDQIQQTFDVRYKDVPICIGGCEVGTLTFVGIGNYIKGGTVTQNGGTTFTDVLGNKDTINVTSTDAYGGGGGVIYQYGAYAGKPAFLRVYGLAGWGVTNFGEGNLGNNIGAFQSNVNNFVTGRPANNIHQIAPGVFSGGVNPYPHSTEFRAGFQWIWNVNPCLSFNFWGDWDHSNRGFQTLGTDAAGNIKVANATRNFYSLGLRPVWWIADNIAIQGQAAVNYIDNNRGYSGTDSFSHAGTMGIFTIAPTIKPKGGYATSPEFRIFATWSVWTNSLRGTMTPVQEGGNFGGSVPPYNRGATQGWLIGTQLEIGF
jgi:maltoporin